MVAMLIGLESTIIDLTDKPTILRLGGLDIKENKNFKKKIYTSTKSKKKIMPGQSQLHYSPGIPLKLI